MENSENNLGQSDLRKSRMFGWQRHYRTISGLSAPRDLGVHLSGSNTLLTSLSGSSQNLLNPSHVLTLQEDAKCRRISSEVMKQRLYESVVHTQRRRRFSARPPKSSSASSDVMAYVRAMRSMPVTPAVSGTASPTEHSPTTTRRFPFRFLSRGATPRALSPEREDSEGEDESFSLGLASVLRPVPRVIRASHKNVCDATENFSLYVPSMAEVCNNLTREVANVSEEEPSADSHVHLDMQAASHIVAAHLSVS